MVAVKRVCDFKANGNASKSVRLAVPTPKAGDWVFVRSEHDSSSIDSITVTDEIICRALGCVSAPVDFSRSSQVYICAYCPSTFAYEKNAKKHLNKCSGAGGGKAGTKA